MILAQYQAFLPRVAATAGYGAGLYYPGKYLIYGIEGGEGCEGGENWAVFQIQFLRALFGGLGPGKYGSSEGIRRLNGKVGTSQRTWKIPMGFLREGQYGSFQGTQNIYMGLLKVPERSI